MRKTILYISLIIISILLFWLDILININTHLINWGDEVLVIWIFQNNISHFLNFDFRNLYETNAMYSFKYSLAFAETMFPQSLLALFLKIFTKNILAQYNLMLVINHLLIFLSSLLFFRQIFKKEDGSNSSVPAILSSFFITYSPFFFIQLGHLQMVFFWPLFFCLYFLNRFFYNNSIKFLLLSALFMGLQILSSLYLGIMSYVVIFLTITMIAKLGLLKKIQVFLTIVIISMLIAAPSLFGYYLVNQTYHPKRDYRDLIIYSAHLTDYLFPHSKPEAVHESILYSSFIFKKISTYNLHLIGENAAFIGLTPGILLIIYFFPRIKKIFKNSINKWQVSFSLDQLSLYGIILILIGFIFSLGPRLWVNGEYTHIPLPYNLILKILPLLEIIRAEARWYFLVIFGVSIILGLGFIRLYEKSKSKKYLAGFLPVIFLAFLFIELWSKPLPISAEEWTNPAYRFLSSSICKTKGKVLLEYPFSYRNWDGDLKKDFRYRSLILLASTEHNCKILSGYTGFEPENYFKIKQEFDNGFSQTDIDLINKMGIDYIKFNLFAITKEEKQFIEKNNLLSKFEKIFEDGNTMILGTNKTKDQESFF